MADLRSSSERASAFPEFRVWARWAGAAPPQTARLLEQRAIALPGNERVLEGVSLRLRAQPV
jgi:hypothetical protein